MSGHGRHEAGGGRPDDELENFQRTVTWSITQTDEYADELLRQVVAIEAVIAARWPRSAVVWWRLARELRRSAAHVQGRTFAERRINSLASGWLERSRLR